jgi:4-hydroxybenzoate polyprenyltransferase
MAESKHPSARTLLVLGRVSNLPTVWSNCLCGWLLAGGGSGFRLILLCCSTSLLYVGGMFLNDAFDASFDRQHRRQRPIPSGAIDESLVWCLGSGLMVAGTLPLLCLGFDTAILSILLVGSILLYDAIHKAIEFSPVIMALCRFFLLLVAASIGEDGVTGLALWSAIALAGWIVGLSYVARRESIVGPLAVWPVLALAVPVLLALLVNNGEYRFRGIALSAGLIGWAAFCLRHTFTSVQRNLGRTVSGLLAGICLVDLLAAPPSPAGATAFVACFGAALLFQRFIPAT